MSESVLDSLSSHSSWNLQSGRTRNYPLGKLCLEKLEYILVSRWNWSLFCNIYSLQTFTTIFLGNPQYFILFLVFAQKRENRYFKCFFVCLKAKTVVAWLKFSTMLKDLKCFCFYENLFLNSSNLTHMHLNTMQTTVKFLQLFWFKAKQSNMAYSLLFLVRVISQ